MADERWETSASKTATERSRNWLRITNIKIKLGNSIWVNTATPIFIFIAKILDS